MGKVIAVIDLKAFYAYVECVDRGLDPWTTPLVVADKSRSVNTIVLSVTPFLKSKGVPSRCRLKELPKEYDYIYATPRMSRYIEMSGRITNIFLDFVSEEDLHTYSIDESFLDLTSYIKYYKTTPKELVKRIINKIKEETGLQATGGIGDNFFLAKIALDIYAKKNKDGIAIFHKEDVPNKLWPITPLSKVWSIGPRMEARLNALGIFNVEQLAKSNRQFIHNKFGIMGDQLVDLANGIDESDIRETYVPKEKSLTLGQTLNKNYSVEEAEVIIREMVDDLAIRMRNHHYVCSTVFLYVGYASNQGGFARSMSLLSCSDDTENLKSAILALYYKNVIDKPIRRLSICFGKLSTTPKFQQLSLFVDSKELEKRHNLQLATDAIYHQFGKDALLKASALLECSTIKERHNQIGGHRR